ncbi:arsenic resistance protein [Natronorubrum daqingense]|uniref:Arsenic resistance protein n=1 Tax=Natronorubrum daqingense TaxID=588898 RepID=A0A1N7FGZ8_9EURY|nr:arsenic resistance protein [Natronorubrum daqingense]APX98446.1 arsenic resistance protein [Natronorubrum daqingense]SIR99708.1 Arsenite efflux pump ArsB, ACR3 family [Natronorubrum daqingense]
MKYVEKYQSVFVLVAIVGGLVLGQVTGVPAVADQLILPFLMVMLFAAFTGIPLSRLWSAFRNRRVVGSSLLINFIWSPLLAVGLGALFLRDHPALWVGLIMLMVTPCTDWYLIFTDIADGDVPLATSVLPYNLVLQLILLPIYLYAFAGELIALPLDVLLESVLLVLVVPLVFGGTARIGLVRTKGQQWFTQRFLPKLSPIQIVFLSLAIGAMFASQGEVIRENPGLLALLAVPVIAFYAITLGIGFGVGRLLSFSYEEMVCFNNTILSRNSPTALAIAVVAFPHEPLIPLALVIGPLLELPLLGIIAQIHIGIKNRGWWPFDPAILCSRG